MPITVYLGLGSNLGDRHQLLDAAIAKLSQRGLTAIRESSRYETDPVGYLDQNQFINLVIEAQTCLAPTELLQTSLEIEQSLGRIRTIKNGPRTIDIDLLFYDDQIIDENILIVPHPRLHQRLFVLRPLVEIAPELWHPVLKKTIKELLKECGREKS